MGALALIVSTNIIAKIWTVLAGSSHLSLDNMKWGITTTNNSVKTVLQTRKYDIIREVQWVIKNSPINIYFLHVYVHQDNSVNFNKLPQIAQLNLICGNMAKQELHQWISDRVNLTPCKPSHTWECWI